MLMKKPAAVVTPESNDVVPLLDSDIDSLKDLSSDIFGMDGHINAVATVHRNPSIRDYCSPNFDNDLVTIDKLRDEFTENHVLSLQLNSTASLSGGIIASYLCLCTYVIRLI